jgi:hypothetical protein
MSALFCRTCYQSKSFENLQQLKRKPILNTLERLLAANFMIEEAIKGSCKHIDRMTDDRNLPR